MSERRFLRIVDIVGLTLIALVVLCSLHPSLVFSRSLITGGDTGAHVQTAYFLKQAGFWHLTPWFPGWFDGVPLYTYYFVVPDLISVLLSYVIPFTVAFKVMTILGSLVMPAAAYVMGRLMRAPRPIPLALAVATLPFLFDASFTIDGGNLFSTMAGEYAFSYSLALAMVSVGLFARGMRTGRGYWLAGLTLSLTLLCHLLPWMFALGMIGITGVAEILARWGFGDQRDRPTSGDLARPVRFACGAGLISLGLVAWWLWPFASLQSLTNSMGYVNIPTSTIYGVFQELGWWNATGGAGGDRWVIVLALCGCIVAWVARQQVGMILSATTIASFLAYLLDPQSAIWNERLVPFWYLSIHLVAGWLIGYLAWRIVEWSMRRREHAMVNDDGELSVGDRAWLGAERRSLTVTATLAVFVLGIGSVAPGLIPAWANALHLQTSGNQVSTWSAFNYSGYQGQGAWPEYHDLMTTMATVGKRDGCGTAMWEYSPDESRFGTTMALMLLPYWTNNCVGSMEGLLFESSATTPYHFLDQAELSAQPSDPQLNLNYGSLDVAAGVRHLQMLGVKYYIAFSAAAVAEANRDSSLRPVATTKYWASSGVRWHVYEVLNAPVVQPLRYAPVVSSNISSRVAWLRANQYWWLTPSSWPYLLAMSGPSSWVHMVANNPVSERPEPVTAVHHVVQGLSTLSFDVSRTGTPILVKTSYFPGWRVSGALGPYRVSPNLMAVVPTDHHVVMAYGPTPQQQHGYAVTGLTALAGLGVLVVSIRKRRATRR